MTASWLRETPIAHRGLHGADAAENSLAAFEAAIARGVAIELDVRSSADGEPMVFHDETLDRMTCVAGRVDARSAAALKTVRLAGTDERIPSLDDALERIGGRAPVLVEVKQGDRRLERRSARALAGRRGAFALQSFDPFAVRRLKWLAPGIPCGLLAGPSRGAPLPQRIVAERLLLAPWVRPDFIAYDVRAPSLAWARRVAAFFAVPLVVWTARSDADRAIADACGANIIFEML